MSDKLFLQSPNLVSQNIERIAALFPNCITETANGKAIDFDLLKQELNTDMVDGLKERYRLEWAGKREAIVTANLPTTKTLRPIKTDSVDFETTQNLYLEGDNLEVLKLLQESYLGKVKMIYIDPPYNTGKDFVYSDKWLVDSDKFMLENAEKDETGQRLFVNPETSGRYHSDWLTMIYPRLKLARNLLTDNGVIFISIDDNEVHNLRKICDEVFGEGNFVGEFVWINRTTPNDSSIKFASDHEFILVYGKSKELTSFKGSKKDLSNYKNPDNDKNGNWIADNPSAASGTESYRFPIVNPYTNETYFPPKGRFWAFSPKRVEEWANSGKLVFPNQFGKNFLLKKYISELKSDFKPLSSIIQGILTSNGTKELNYIFSEGSPFKYPKPSTLLKLLLEQTSNTNDIILDFFSGSATTAHAVMQLNAEDGGNRKFIMVQVPEATDEKSEAFKAGYKNICEIGKERIRRAAKKIQEEQAAKQQTAAGQLGFEIDNSPSLDLGFRVYRLDSSNMQDVYYKPQDYKQENLDLFASNIKPDRTPEDLLTQVMLSWGLPLHYKIETLTLQGKQVFKVAQDSLFACFDNGIDEAFAKEIATHQPLRIVFKDDSFTNDTAKENVKQLLKQLSSNTEMKVI